MNEGLNHKHKYLMDTEVVFTPDGGVQPKGTIFLECIKDGCSYIIRDNEIIQLIEGLIEENVQLRERVEVYHDELLEVILVNCKMLTNYAVRIAELVQMLQMVEWTFNSFEETWCFWCHGEEPGDPPNPDWYDDPNDYETAVDAWKRLGHKDDCAYQRVMGLVKRK